MTLPLYLAMTAAEISGCNAIPAHFAYMACHFSPYSTGLSNSPVDIPKGAMLILNDRIPVHGHDPKQIATQLKELCERLYASSILLDLQRPEDALTSAIVAEILTSVQCPVGVSELYAKELACPVFISSPPLHRKISQWIAPWQGREIWLEAALDSCTWSVTETGSNYTFGTTDDASLLCKDLHCHYSIKEHDRCVQISLERNMQDLNGILEEAETLGISKAIGLYQQLGKQ